MKLAALLLAVPMATACSPHSTGPDTYSVKVAMASNLIAGADPNGKLSARITSDPPGIDCQAAITNFAFSLGDSTPTDGPHVGTTGACEMTVDRMHETAPNLTVTPDGDTALDHWSDKSGLEDRRPTVGVPDFGGGQQSYEYVVILMPKSMPH